MVLGSIFGENRGMEVLQNPDRQSTVIVAKDGSGDTDDIGEAMKMLPDTGGIVEIKEGTYTLTAPISITKSNITLSGVGWGTVIYTTSDIAMISINGVEGTILKDFKLLGNSTGAAQYGIYGVNCDNFAFDKLRIMLCNVNGIYLDSSCDIGSISHCQISGSGGDNLYIAGDSIRILGNEIWEGANGILLYENNRCIVTQNVCRTNDNDGISLNGADNCVISHNSCTLNTEYGIELEGAGEVDNIVTSNNAKGNTIASILDNGASTTIANNEV